MGNSAQWLSKTQKLVKNAGAEVGRAVSPCVPGPDPWLAGGTCSPEMLGSRCRNTSISSGQADVKAAYAQISVKGDGLGEPVAWSQHARKTFGCSWHHRQRASPTTTAAARGVGVARAKGGKRSRSGKAGKMAGMLLRQ